MKKIIALVLSFVMMLSFTACGSQSADTENVSGMGVSAEVLEALGMSEEEFAAMDKEQQQAIMDEMGRVLEQKEQQENDKPENKTYTPADVEGAGEYKVVLGDYMNSITLYYKDGVLVKIEEEFQKNSEEMREYSIYEGDSLADYQFNFIDWDGVSLQEIIDGMKDYGGFGNYKIYKAE